MRHCRLFFSRCSCSAFYCFLISFRDFCVCFRLSNGKMLLAKVSWAQVERWRRINVACNKTQIGLDWRFCSPYLLSRTLSTLAWWREDFELHKKKLFACFSPPHFSICNSHFGKCVFMRESRKNENLRSEKRSCLSSPQYLLFLLTPSPKSPAHTNIFFAPNFLPILCDSSEREPWKLHSRELRESHGIVETTSEG